MKPSPSIRREIIWISLLFLGAWALASFPGPRAGAQMSPTPQPTPTPVYPPGGGYPGGGYPGVGYPRAGYPGQPTPRPTPAATRTDRGGRSSRDRSGTGESQDDSGRGRKRASRSEDKGKGAAPSGGAITGTPKVQKATQGPPARSAQAVGGKETPPKLQMPIGAVLGSLHFSPMDQQVKPGAEFETKVVFTNRAGRSARGFRIGIAYDPQRLTFLGFDQSAIASALEGTTEGLTLKQSPGRLLFSCMFGQPVGEEQAPLLALKFKACDAAGFTSLRYLCPPEGLTSVIGKGENLLGAQDQNLRGVVHGYVFISDSPSNEFVATGAAATTETQQMGMADVSAMLPVADSETSAALAAAKAWVHPPGESLREVTAFVDLQGPEEPRMAQGDSFWVDLVLHNDDLLPIDSLGVRVEFDPVALEVVDEDENNWIVRGINLWDGAFHESYPFDFHKANQANNSRGVILYQAGRQYQPWAFPTGVFARIHFRAKTAADRTAIRVARGEKNANPQTYVRSYGLDRLKDTWKDSSAPRVRLSVSPARLAQTAR